MKKLLFSIALLVIFAHPAFARYVSVSWGAVPGATSYTLYWGPTSGGAYPYKLNVGGVTTYQLAINEETTYMIVTATDGSGEGPASVEIPLVNESDDLLQDGYPTPEQIAVFLPDNGFAESMTATIRYRKFGEGKWTVGHELFQIDNHWAEPGFAWTITGLDPGSSYLVEVTTHDGGADVVYTKTMTTSSLPAAAGAVTKFIPAGSNTAYIRNVFDTAVPGDVIQFANGTYNVDGLALTTSGTTNSSIYIRGESRDGVVLADPTGVVLNISVAEHIVLEDLTLQGSGVDSGIAASSQGISYWGGYNIKAANAKGHVTIRRVTVTGVDKGFVVATYTRQMIIYDNIFQGNNSWTQDYYPYGGSGAPGAGDGTPDVAQNIFWNDDGVYVGGAGNVVFNNTIGRFGDCLAAQNPSGDPSVDLHFYRNLLTMCGDDTFESDYGTRNITFYDNNARNMMTLVSTDPMNGGPLIVFRNIGVNIGRQIWKLNGDTVNPIAGMFFYNNTTVHSYPRSTGVDYGRATWLQFNQNPGHYNVGFQNNIHIFQKPKASFEATLIYETKNLDPIDMTHNSWYPGGAIKYTNTGGTFTSLSAAAAGLPATTPIFSGEAQRHVSDFVSELQPFDIEVVLGSDFYTEVTTVYTPTLAEGGVSKNSGVAIAGVTDGYTGKAPDRGAVIAGVGFPAVGARTGSY